MAGCPRCGHGNTNSLCRQCQLEDQREFHVKRAEQMDGGDDE